jgi:CubicO group peptidase (beta-lactamase class C family)
MKSARILITFLLLAGLAVAQTAKTPDAAKLKSAAEYSALNRGVAVLVMKGERIVFEEYQNGATADRPHFLASGTKSFSGVMLAAAIDDGIVKSFDEKVSDTITEWKSDPLKSKITLRELLTLTSGIDAGQIGRVPTYDEALGFSARSAAGTRFEYGPVPFQIFGEFLTRKLKSRKETVNDYLKRRILDPLGIKVGFWRLLAGNPLLPQGASLTAREWAKFGLFMKSGADKNGKQLIKKKLLDELVIGSKANPAYGITFWLNRDGKTPAGRQNGMRIESLKGDDVSDLYMAAGAGNQRLYVVPSKDLVIVRFGNFGEWDDREFLTRMLRGKSN